MKNMEETRISSLSEYIKWARECHKINVPELHAYYDDSRICFRGQASISWNLIPSLFRDSGRLEYEHEMLFQASNLLWSELNGCKSNMEKLVILQHYGLQTRLLDVTYNSLVALYFACQNVKKDDDIDNERDGVVYSGLFCMSSTKVALAISEYVFNHQTENVDVKELQEICNNYKLKIKQMEDISFFNPPYNNSRIAIQNGAFLMSPLLMQKEDNSIRFAKDTYVKSLMEKAFDKKCIIPHKYKSDLLTELDYVGINKATLFTDITSKLEYLNEKKEKEWEDVGLF